mmetsp:Transcript_35283/g.53423  ORF Transcript_35283/g.53423 Transcript_35283/m.53423 type:complete len:82 (+) Transcript_35283:1094-1339(+)
MFRYVPDYDIELLDTSTSSPLIIVIIKHYLPTPITSNAPSNIILNIIPIKIDSFIFPVILQPRFRSRGVLDKTIYVALLKQ